MNEDDWGCSEFVSDESFRMADEIMRSRMSPDQWRQFIAENTCVADYEGKATPGDLLLALCQIALGIQIIIDKISPEVAE